MATPDGRRNLNLWTTNITQPDENKTLNRSRLLTQTTLRDFAELWPGKFRNETNGVSPRRFLLLANPRLSGLITARLGDQRWLTDLDRLAELEA
ncbi:MAG TPA: glycogen/starch/alpha-glucan phosphorylase, partial [Streptosporangiaceae bacterium]